MPTLTVPKSSLRGRKDISGLPATALPLSATRDAALLAGDPHAAAVGAGRGGIEEDGDVTVWRGASTVPTAGAPLTT